MKCPIDGNELKIAERQGIEIDYCPQCRGVWLDRGELDKIIERTVPLPPEPPMPFKDDNRPDYDDDRYERGNQYGYEKRKRKSFLDDLFDF